MRVYEVYSLHTCRVIASNLTRQEAEEIAGPFGSFAFVRPMRGGGEKAA